MSGCDTVMLYNGDCGDTVTLVERDRESHAGEPLLRRRDPVQTVIVRMNYLTSIIATGRDE